VILSIAVSFPKIIGCYAATFFVIFYLGYLFAGWTVTRWGAGWEIRGLDDLASLPVLLIVLAVLTFVLNPVTNGFTRHFEHQADQFGLEATHGLTPDSGQVAAQAFQIDGDAELADPAPNPVDVFLFYDHPPIPDRFASRVLTLRVPRRAWRVCSVATMMRSK